MLASAGAHLDIKGGHGVRVPNTLTYHAATQLKPANSQFVVTPQ